MKLKSKTTEQVSVITYREVVNDATISFTRDELRVLAGIIYTIGGPPSGPRGVIDKLGQIIYPLVGHPDNAIMDRQYNRYLPDTWEEFNEKFGKSEE